MFLIDRPASARSAGADLFPQQFFRGSGDLVRVALMTSQKAAEPAASVARRPAPQVDLGRPEPARRRKTG